MEENQVNSVVTEQSTGSGNPVQTSPSGVPENNNGTSVMQPDRTFTRDEVTKILKRRLDRYQNSVYSKYGVKDSAELDSLFDKAKSYDDIIKSRDEALEKVAFLGNNINPDKYDDIRTYFKGKGLQFTEDELKRQLESHPEWIKQAPVTNNKPITTVTPIGTPNSGPVDKSEHDLAKRIFGDDLFD